jgi:hypothetical protein
MVVLEMKITEKVTTWCLEHFKKFHEKALISLSLSLSLVVLDDQRLLGLRKCAYITAPLL